MYNLSAAIHAEVPWLMGEKDISTKFGQVAIGYLYVGYLTKFTDPNSRGIRIFK